MKSFSPFRLFLSGFLIGVADLVPGVSGGTIALLLGLYPELIASLDAVRGGFRAACSQWRFLFPLGAGVLFALFSLSPVLSLVFQSEGGSVILYAVLMALLISSLPIALRDVDRWNFSRVAALVGGALFTLTVIHLSPGEPSPVVTSVGIIDSGWIALSAALAICATLLPGISGSLILVLCGTYPLAIQALSEFFIHLSALRVFFAFAVGIGCGMLLFTRALRWLLTNYRPVTMAVLSGCMVGAIPVLWPFRWQSGEWRAPNITSFCDGGALFLFAAVFASGALLRHYRSQQMSLTK